MQQLALWFCERFDACRSKNLSETAERIATVSNEHCNQAIKQPDVEHASSHLQVSFHQMFCRKNAVDTDSSRCAKTHRPSVVYVKKHPHRALKE